MRERFIFAGECSGRDLRHHETGFESRRSRQKRRQSLIKIRMHQSVSPPLTDDREIGTDDREEIADHTDRLPVEVSTAQQLPALHHERVVRRGVEFTFDDGLRELQGLPRGPVHLWHTAQRVRILHPWITKTMRLANRTAGEECTKQRSGSTLTLLSTRILNTRVKGIGRPEQRFKTHRRRDVRRIPEALQFGRRERRHGGVRLRAINERQPLLRRQRDRHQARRRQRILRIVQGPIEVRVAFPDQAQRQMRERCQISTCTHTPLLRHQWPHPRVEHREQCIDELRARAGEAGGQHVGAQQHHRAHFALRQRIANARRVTAHQIAL